MAARGKVLVTGGAGYIGSHVVLALLEAGFDVAVIDDLSTGRREALPAGVPLLQGDVGRADVVREAMARERPRAVLHFAGSIVAPESTRQPLLYYANNTCASRTLIAACVEAKVECFLFSSTAAVYGNPERVPIVETAPLRPINPYGASKLMTEWILRDVGAAHGLRHLCLRYFNVAGADPDGRSGQSTAVATHLIKIACQAALGRRDGVDVFGEDYPTADGTCVRDYIHVTDLAHAHVVALEHLLRGATGEAFNCGYGRGYSVREVLAAVQRVSGCDFEIRSAGRRPGDPAQLVADATRLRKALSWSPRHDDLEVIVRTALDWERRLAPAPS